MRLDAGRSPGRFDGPKMFHVKHSAPVNETANCEGRRLPTPHGRKQRQENTCRFCRQRDCERAMVATRLDESRPRRPFDGLEMFHVKHSAPDQRDRESRGTGIANVRIVASDDRESTDRLWQQRLCARATVATRLKAGRSPVAVFDGPGMFHVKHSAPTNVTANCATLGIANSARSHVTAGEPRPVLAAAPVREGDGCDET